MEFSEQELEHHPLALEVHNPSCHSQLDTGSASVVIKFIYKWIVHRHWIIMPVAQQTSPQMRNASFIIVTIATNHVNLC